MKILLRIEKYLPFVAIIIGFLAAKNKIDAMVYLWVAMVFGLYFFPVRLFADTGDKKWFQILTSLLFANILIFLGIFLINPELEIIGNALSIFAVVCILLLLYKFFFEKLKAQDFVLLLGFNLLACADILIG